MKYAAESLLSPFNFILPTSIRYGMGVVNSLPGELVTKGHRNVLVISDGGVAGLPFFAAVLHSLKADSLKVEVFKNVEANPKDGNVQKAADAARTINADCIVAIGGGSPIDCAKAASIVAVQGGNVRDYEGGNNINNDPLPIYTVPTTAGTGSEITFSAVITDSAEKHKFTVKTPAIAPKISFVDPELTISVPPDITASTGLDALTHAIEAYTAKNAEPISDAAALYAIELISHYLITAVKDGNNKKARAGMLSGSLLAGIAFSHADVASVHCLAEALGGLYDVPHGVCNAITLPVVMEYNTEYAAERYARIASAMGISFSDPAEGAKKAVEKVIELVKDAGLPSFRSLGVEESHFETIAEKSACNGSNGSNPRPMKKSDYIKLLKLLL